MHNSLFILSFVFFTFVLSQQQEVLNQCITVAGSQLCVRVTSYDCFQLVGTVKWNGLTVYGPRNVPIGVMLSAIQDRLDDPNRSPGDTTICQALSLGPGLSCSLCATGIDKMRIDGDDLHYCGSLIFNCSGIVQNLPPFCVNITNCRLYGCKNNCNNVGTCSALGICRCNKDYYGLDCSVSIADGCVQSGNLEKACWQADFPDCHTLDFKVTTSVGTISRNYQKIDEMTSLDLMPCRNLSQNMKCQTCVAATDLNVVGDQLVGCPTLKIACSDMEVSNYKINCLTLVTSPQLVCQPDNSDVAMAGGAGKTVLLILASILALLVIAGLGYYLITKYFGYDIPNVFQPVDVYTEEGEGVTPLKSDIQIVDEEEEM